VRQSSGGAEFGAAQAEARLVRTEPGGAGGASRRARSSATRVDPGRGQSSAAQRIGLRRTDLGGSVTNPAAGARGARRRAQCARGARSSVAGGVRPARAELGGGQGVAEPAVAAGSGWGMEPPAAIGGWLTEARGEQGRGGRRPVHDTWVPPDGG